MLEKGRFLYFAGCMRKGDEKIMKRNLSIAVFDSGLGGMSLLAELIQLLPNENFLYFGDTANAPYGTKSAEEVKSLTVKNFEYLLSKETSLLQLHQIL